MEGWHDFFHAEVDASAARAGLLFVGLSLNITQILKFPWLPRRAEQTLVMLMMALLQASATLLPGQSLHVLGLELLATLAATAMSTNVVVRNLRARPDPDAYPQYERSAIANAALGYIALIPALVGAVMVTAGLSARLYWVAGAILLSFVYSILQAWVLLVEILR